MSKNELYQRDLFELQGSQALFLFFLLHLRSQNSAITMLLLILLFVFSVISRCSAQTTSTVSSTELLTDTETSFRTSTRTTLSHHSVIETDASTVTTGTSKTHTKISTYSSIPTESVTKTSIETSTIDLTEQPSPPPSKTIVTLAPQPSPTCCSWSEGTGPYTRVGSDYAVDTTCLHPRFVSRFMAICVT